MYINLRFVSDDTLKKNFSKNCSRLKVCVLELLFFTLPALVVHKLVACQKKKHWKFTSAFSVQCCISLDLHLISNDWFLYEIQHWSEIC